MARGGNGNKTTQGAQIDAHTDLALQLQDLLSGAQMVSKEPDWHYPLPAYVHEAEQFEAEYGVAVPLGVSLLGRGKGDFKRVYDFYHPTRALIETPDKSVPGMSKAGKSLHSALTAGKKIAIFGDYDPDGTTGTASLVMAVRDYATEQDQIYYEQADQNKGFGLTHEFVRRMHERGVFVIITVDNGSADVEQIKYAKSLGMKVIVVDHHTASDNSADYHLNPKLHKNGCDLTGSPLAWKLGLAVHQAAGEKVPDKYYGTPLFLAGMGLQADRGRLDKLEHRAFIHSPQLEQGDKVVPIGLVAFADYLAEHPQIGSSDYVMDPSNRIEILAALNVAKRHAKANSNDPVQIMLARNRHEAMEVIPRVTERLIEVREARAKMRPLVSKQVNHHSQKDNTTRAALVRDFEDFFGCAGLLTPESMKETGKPTIVGVAQAPDQFGQVLVKFRLGISDAVARAARKEEKENEKTGKKSTRWGKFMPGVEGNLISDEEFQSYCQFKMENAAEEVVIGGRSGGHPPLLSGQCTLSNWPKLKKRFEEYYREIEGPKRTGLVLPPKAPSRHAAYVKCKDPLTYKEFVRLEKQANQAAPWDYEYNHFPPSVPMRGALKNIHVDEKGYNRATWVLGPDPGESREVFLSRKIEKELPKEGQVVRWVAPVQGRDTYTLEIWHEE